MNEGSTTRSRPLFAAPAAAALLALAAMDAGAQAARDYISIVGSSTVYPFATVVAEKFGRSNPSFKTPKVESTGSGGGIKLFCGGIGVQHPDVANASRRITASEVETCARNGVDGIVEVRFGFDGIVLANAKSSPQLDFTLRDIYLALAARVPDPKGGAKLVPNPYTSWSEIDPALPAENIEVLGPPPTSGTRDAFVELAMEPGCKSFDFVAALDENDHDAFLDACHRLREDGRYTDAGENDNLIVQKLVKSPAAVGVFGYSFLEQNTDKVKGARVNGAAPDFDAIADGRYPLSRPLFFYVKRAHVDKIPGIREYVNEFMSEAATGEFGYLVDKGLIPLSDAERERAAADAAALKTLAAAPRR